MEGNTNNFVFDFLFIDNLTQLRSSRS